MTLLKEIFLIIQNVASSSSIHAIPNIAKTNKIGLKLMWLTLLFSFGCFSFILVIQEVLDYFEYPTTTKIKYVNENQVEIPAFGICNNNPFATNYSINFLADLIDYDKKKRVNL